MEREGATTQAGVEQFAGGTILQTALPVNDLLGGELLVGDVLVTTSADCATRKARRPLLAHALVLDHRQLPVDARNLYGFGGAIGPFDLDLIDRRRGPQTKMQRQVIL
jgi:hypothetical protein